jgi:hypothetical protein
MTCMKIPLTQNSHKSKLCTCEDTCSTCSFRTLWLVETNIVPLRFTFSFKMLITTFSYSDSPPGCNPLR